MNGTFGTGLLFQPALGKLFGQPVLAVRHGKRDSLPHQVTA